MIGLMIFKGKENWVEWSYNFLKYISEHMSWSGKLKIKMSSAMYTAQQPE